MKAFLLNLLGIYENLFELAENILILKEPVQGKVKQTLGFNNSILLRFQRVSNVLFIASGTVYGPELLEGRGGGDASVLMDDE